MAVKLKQFLNAFSKQGQDVETMFQQLKNLRSLNTSSGAQLDGIGSIVGETRQGRDDEEYRSAISTRIFLNVSSGEPETLIRATEFITQGVNIKLQEIPHATVQIFTNGTVIDSTTTEQIQALAPAGVKVFVVSIAGNNAFQFSEEGQSPPSEETFFSEAINSTDLYLIDGIPVGGQFADIL